MKSLDEIRRQLSGGEFDFSRHGFLRSIERNIAETEIRQCGSAVEIVEEYPDDKYSSSCLLLGFTKSGRPLHLQVSLAETGLLRIITVYEPNDQEWINFRERK